MSKLAILRLLDGDLEQGVKVILKVNTFDSEETALPEIELNSPHLGTEISGTLPPNLQLADTIKQWQLYYRSFRTTRIKNIIITVDASIDKLRSACQELEQKLRSQLNTWLLSDSFRPIRDKWLEELMNDEVRILVRTSNHSLLRLPWHLWELVERNTLAEVALSAFDGESIAKLKTPTLRGKVRILAILGDSTGINLKEDEKLLKNLANAETSFLVEPQRQNINDQLWEQEWDILFFAGHSRTEGEQGRIYINQTNQTNTNSLTITELRYALKKAVDKGLQLAIFNSCDGMGLAFELQQLQIPQVIVMREPVPDKVAQNFLRYFLPKFANGQSLYLSERESRLRLHGLEDEFPSASWLPVIFQNPAIVPPTWNQLGRRPTTLCPYRGLFAFREEDASFFYGRESFTGTLAEAVQKHSFVSLVGASGSGKSSVVFAGLVPELRQQGDWQILSLRPGHKPFEELAKGWVSLRTPDQPQAQQLASVLQLAEIWQKNETALSTTIENAVWEKPGTKLLIIVDQFEELYTQCQDEKERQAFVDRLLEVARLTNIVLLLTIRTDFLGQALGYAPLADALRNGNRMLGAMSPAELQAAIAQPAALLDVTLEEGLAERMIKAIGNSLGNLPLLQFALQEMWSKRQGLQLTHAAYEEIGGLEAAVAQYAEEVYSKLNESEKERSRQIFLQLVRPNEQTEDTRRLATRAEIGDRNWELVTHLASERLVMTGQDAIAKTETVELIHEALIREWNRLRDWIEEDRAFRLWQERLRGAMQQWESSGRDEGAFLRGKPLVEAEDWFKNRSEELAAEQEFITASWELRESEQEKQKRQRKRTLVGLTGGLIGALGLAAIAGVGWWQATNAATNERIKVLVFEAQSLFDLSGAEEYRREDISTSDENSSLTKEQQEEEEEEAKKKKVLFQEASLKAIEAGQELKQARGVETETQFQVLEMLRQVVGTTEEPKTFELPECEMLKRGPVSLTWTSDRKTITCVNYDGTVRLYDGETGKKTNVFRGDSEWVDDVDFSPDGKIVASGTVDGTVKLWERSTGKEIRSLKGHLSQVSSISFSPDGQTIVAGNYDGTIIICEVATGRELRTLPGHPESEYHRLGIDYVFFSPNSQYLLSKGQDETVKLWEVSTGKELKTFHLPVDESDLQFSADSQTLVYPTDTIDKLGHKTVRFWNILENREVKSISVPGEAFFSPDGKLIAVIDYEDKDILEDFTTDFTKHSVSLWDTSTGKKIKTLSNLPGVPAEISFSPDSSLIAVYIYDNNDGANLGPVLGSKAKITFWKTNGAKLKTIEQLGEIFQINFSPDGQKVAISSLGVPPENGFHVIFKLWDVSTGRQLKTLSDEPIIFSPKGMAVGLGSLFSPDGKMISTVSSSGIAKFYDSSTGQELSSPNVSPFRDISQRTSANKKGVLTLRTDGSLRFRDRATGEESRMNRYDSMMVSAARISDDDKTITTVNWYGKLQERELTTDRILRSINLPFDKSASSLKFSPDGRKVAAARSNYTVKVWDATTGKEIITLKNYLKVIDEANDWRGKEVHFSPNGKMVAVLGGESGASNREKGSELELWEISTGKAIRLSGIPSGVINISFSPNSDELAILKTDNTIQLWKLSTRQLIKTIKPPFDTTERIQFSHDSNLLLAWGSAPSSIGSDDNLKILNIETEREIASFNLSSGLNLINSADFSSDGKTLILQYDNQFTFLDLDLENLLERSCNISHDYLKNNPKASAIDKRVCD
jgi:WD40 repeat protein/energy-coupling factor transporter ATP-binding protein EcfA2